MNRVMLLLLFIALLTACGTSPTPERVEVPVEITVEIPRDVTVEVPMTVEVPVTVIVTQAPPPTYTPYPTYTPVPPLPTYTPYPTSVPSDTATPRPQPTATPSPVPVTVPSGWIEYNGITDEFSIAHPPEWSPADEEVNSISFQLPGFSYAVFGLYRNECNLTLDSDYDELKTCLVDAVLESFYGDQTKIGDIGTHDDGRNKWFYVEVAAYDNIYEQWSYVIHAVAPCDTPSTEIAGIYGRIGTKSITDDERDTFWLVASTFVKAAN